MVWLKNMSCDPGLQDLQQSYSCSRCHCQSTSQAGLGLLQVVLPQSQSKQCPLVRSCACAHTPHTHTHTHTYTHTHTHTHTHKHTHTRSCHAHHANNSLCLWGWAATGLSPPWKGPVPGILSLWALLQASCTPPDPTLAHLRTEP